MKRFVSLGIVIFWLVMVVLLVRRTLPEHKPAPASLPISSLPHTQEDWMGIYHQNTKIGYVHRQVIPTESGYRWEERSRMKLRVLDTT